MRAARIILAGLFLLPAPARATYSIAAADTATREVGGAGTSCVGTFSVSNIYGSAPDRGVVHAQAQFLAQARDRAVQRLNEGATPATIIAELISPAFDPSSAVRQYAVVDATGALAQHTGAGTMAYAGHLTGQSGTRFFAAQGNILTSRRVLEQAAAAFPAGCDLAESLLLALEAGAANGEGDSRCTPRGIPSDGAYLRVDRPGEPAGSWLLLQVDNTAPADPLAQLRVRYDAWRQSHPCPAPPDAGLPDAGLVPDADPEDREADDAPPAAEAGPSDAGDASAAEDAAATARDQGVLPGPVGGTIGGCACRAEGGLADGSAWIGLLVLALHARRRRR